MTSLKSFTSQCLGISQPSSVVRDVFSLNRGLQRPVSLRRQMELARGDSFGINAIAVCPDSFTDDDWDEMEFAIQAARDIYDDVGIGIRDVQYWSVPAADNPSQCTLGDDDDDLAESRELSNDYTVDNDYLDVFFVRWLVGGTAGWSAVDGPCSKDSVLGFNMSGSVVELLGAPAVTAVVLAHEMGHYFGLDHTTLSNNFMRASVGAGDTNITSGQGNVVRDKTCFVGEVC
jgi:hypothetical protein